MPYLRSVYGKFPEMVVEPSHRGLDDPVQSLEVHRGSHGDASPDQWLDVLKLNPQGRDSVRGRGGHAASLIRVRGRSPVSNPSILLMDWFLAIGLMTR